jgi:hypothetical protein
MTALLIFVAGMAIVVGLVWVMIRLERAQRRRIERRREAWKAAGGVDAYPDDYIGGYSHGNFG